jgi:hypothetical protein
VSLMDSRPGMPPMSTTSLPSSSEIEPSRPPPPVRPPILASDILREEIAPLAPAQRALPFLLWPLAAALGTWGVAALEGWLSAPSPDAWVVCVISILAVAGAGLSFPYAPRAALATLAGLSPLILGALGRGPLGFLASQGDAESGAGVVLVTLLPATLLFRSRYRAYAPARILLGLALALSSPAVYFLVERALHPGAPPLARGMEALAATAVLTSFGGFLGPETTGNCQAWAVLILTLYPAAGCAVLWAGSHQGASGPLAIGVAGSLGQGLAAAAASVGIHQLLAAMLAGRARQADVHKIVGPSAEEEP